MRIINLSTAAVCSCLLWNIASANAQGTIDDYKRAAGLRKSVEGLAIHLPGRVTWVEGNGTILL
jgi:hypothetical protein